MAESAAFSRIVRERWTPAIAVQADAAVQSSCASNGVSFTDLLRACSDGAGVGAQGFPFRVEKGTIRIEGNFPVRFYEWSSTQPTPAPAVVEHLHQTWIPRLLRKHANHIKELSQNSILSPSRLKEPLSQLTPWFVEYTQEFSRTMMFQPHESIDHPLCALYALDALAEDITAAALELLNPHLERSSEPSPNGLPDTPPSVLKLWDPAFPRHFVLVVDTRRGSLSSEELQAKGDMVAKAVEGALTGGPAGPPRVSALLINSGSGAEDEAGVRVQWHAFEHCSLPSKGENDIGTVRPSAGEPLEGAAFSKDDGPARGCWLSQKNLDDVTHLISSVIRDSLCDPMERRMNVLRDAVSQHRGTFFRSMSRIMGFSSRIKTKSSQSGDTSAPQLPEDTPQSRLRLLGDLYFMIGQYQDAEGCFSDAADEFRSQKAMQKWAAALEALSLSRFMQVSAGGPSLDIWRPMDEAFRVYASLQPAGGVRVSNIAMLVVRCGLLFGGTMLALGNLGEAFACYTRCSNFAEPVLSALLLEQAGLCKAAAPLPQMRRAAHYLMLAGSRYQKLKLTELAVVVFRAVADCLNSGWGAANRMLSEAGAVACQDIARWRDAALYLRDVLSGDTSESTADAQIRQLSHLRKVLCNARDVGQPLFTDAAVLSLKVPIIKDTEVPMQLHSLRVCINSPDPAILAAVDVSAKRQRKALEDAAAQQPRHKLLLLKPRSGTMYSTVFADEPMTIHVTVTNPLDVEISIKDLRIACACCMDSSVDAAKSAQSDKTVAPPTFPSNVLLPSDLNDLCMKAESCTDLIDSEPQSFVLGARQSSTRALVVRPGKPGWLYIGGARWEVDCGSVADRDPMQSRSAPFGPEFSEEDPKVQAAALFKPSVRRLRYGTLMESRTAADYSRGMSISAAVRAADSVQPPRLDYTDRTCLAFRVLPPGPLLFLRPAEIDGNMTVPNVAADVVSQLFTDWEQAGRQIMLPKTVLVGQLVPLPFVVSKPASCSLSKLTVLTTCSDVSLQPSFDIEAMMEPWDVGKLGDASGRELMDAASVYDTGRATSEHRRRGSILPDSDGAVQSFPVDLAACEWVEGSDGLHHMRLPLWMHPQVEGQHTVRIVLGYEDEGGSFRLTRFEMTMAVQSALVCRNVRMLPVAGSLTDWRLAVTIAGSRHATTLSKLFTLHMKEVLLQMRGWEVVPTGPDVFYTSADGGTGFSHVKRPRGDADVASKQVHHVLCESETFEPFTAEMVVRRTAGCEPTASKVQGKASKDMFEVIVVWSMQGSQAAPRVGLSRLSGVQPLDLIQDTAVRLAAEVSSCQGVDDVEVATTVVQEAGGEMMVLKAPQGPLGHTDVELLLRLRNNSSNAVSLSVECGDLVQQGRRAVPEQPSILQPAPSGIPAGALVALPQASRTHWLGPVRRHVQRLDAMAEIEMRAHVRLLGCGPFSIQDYVCTWRGADGELVNRATQGPVLAFLVEPKQEAKQTSDQVAEAEV